MKKISSQHLPYPSRFLDNVFIDQQGDEFSSYLMEQETTDSIYNSA